MNFRRAIVAFDDKDDDLRYSIEQGAKRIASKVRTVRSLEELERIKLGQSDLLIIDPDLPPAAGYERVGGGVRWVQDRHARSNPPPTIVFVEELGRYQNTLAGLDLCEMIGPSEEDGYNKLLAELAQKLARVRDNQPDAPRNVVVAVSVSADKPLLTFVADIYTSSGTRCFRLREDADRVDPNQLALIIAASQQFGADLSASMNSTERWEQERMTWEARYRRLGRDLYDWLATPRLLRMMETARDLANAAPDREPRVALRLRVEREAYDACWEGLCRETPSAADTTGYLFRDHTIARQLANDNGARELEIADGTVNVLLVHSELVAGMPMGSKLDGALQKYLDKVGDQFPPLNSSEEVAGLQRLSAPATAATGISFDLIANDEAGEGAFSLWEEVKRKLRDARENGMPYDVLHFAGHAIAWSEQAQDEFGKPIRIDHSYILFSGHPENEAIPAAEFADTLATYGVQLAYLSCCRGTAGKIAYEIATRGVPLAIGFTGDVRDSHAVEFATHFYEELLTNDLRVCAAYDSTRRWSHGHLGTEPIWAWPVLIAQPNEWSKIEACLRA